MCPGDDYWAEAYLEILGIDDVRQTAIIALLLEINPFLIKARDLYALVAGYEVLQQWKLAPTNGPIHSVQDTEYHLSIAGIGNRILWAPYRSTLPNSIFSKETQTVSFSVRDHYGKKNLGIQTVMLQDADPKLSEGQDKTQLVNTGHRFWDQSYHEYQNYYSGRYEIRWDGCATTIREQFFNELQNGGQNQTNNKLYLQMIQSAHQIAAGRVARLVLVIWYEKG